MPLFLQYLVEKIKKLFSAQTKQTAFLKVVYVDVTTEKLPNSLAMRTLYLVHGSGKPKWLRFKCPCGCNQEISLNLMKSYSPYWVVNEETDGTITVNPSVNIVEGCKSHFFLRNNKIVWCD